ncbi:MAG: GHKL domain-containing protein [Defluviitaleaceae bacterium]|nr:GHKL domain-containing protein [Defluviitaleaceae bacterium]MCL2275147.1 GHKL domain-containing protein [Defluviitaleaceae bacterium]
MLTRNDFVIYFLLTTPAIATFFITFLNISTLKLKLKHVTITIITMYFVSIISLHVPLIAFNILGNMFLLLCLIVVAYKNTNDILLSVFYSSFAVVISMFSNTIIGIPVLLALDVLQEDIHYSIIIQIVITVPTIALSFLMSKRIGEIIKKSFSPLSKENKRLFTRYGFLLSTLVYLISQVNTFVYRIVENRIILSSINVIVITVIFFTAFIIIIANSRTQQKLMESEYKNQSLKDLEAHNQQLELAYDELRSYRHDHLSLLHAIIGFANDENHERIKTYLNDTLKYAKETLDKLDDAMNKLGYIHIPELKGLLSVKFAHALANNIEVELDLAEPIDDIPLNRMDLCRIVGIVVDNAIEELLSNDSKTKLLKFGILPDDERILIVCKNTCTSLPLVENIFEKGFTTKGNSRGLGLYTLKKMSKKCNNLSVTAYPKDNEFALIISIRLV